MPSGEASTPDPSGGTSTTSRPEQFLVLQYERCASDPAGQLDATYRFLGLPDYRPADLHRPVNVSGEKVPVDADAVRRLTDLYASDVLDLRGLFPHVDLSLWPNFAGLPA